MVSLFIFCLIVSWLMTMLLVVNLRSQPRGCAANPIQRFHKGNIPRLGGLAITSACVIGWTAMALFPSVGIYLNASISWKTVVAFLVVLIPITFAGTFEDWTQRLSVRWRLVFTGLSASLACALLGIEVPRLGLGFLDLYWTANP